MRKYEGMRLPPGVDKALRKELLKPDRWLKQAQAALARSISNTNQPTAVIGLGDPGAPGNPSSLPDHKHEITGHGGNILGTTASTISSYGTWYVDGKYGFKTTAPGARLHINIPTTTETGLIIQAAAGQTGNLLYCEDSSTTIMGTRIGSQGHLAINTSASDNIVINAFLSKTVTAGVNMMAFNGTLTDNTGGNQHKGINSLLTLQGSGDYSSFEQVGFTSTIDYQGTNASAPLITGSWFIANKSGTGAVDTITCAAFLSTISGSSGNVVLYNGNYIASPSMGGLATLGTAIGLFIENIASGTTNYSIKSVGGNMYHLGKIGINIDPPTAMLHIVSSASSVIGIKVRRSASGSTGDLIQCLDQSSNKLSGFDAKGRVTTPVDGSTTPIFNDITTTTKKLGIDASGISASTTQYWKASDISGVVSVIGDQAPAVSAGRMGKIDLTNQGAAIGATNLTNGAKVGLYQVDWYIEDTTADVTAGTIQFQVNYTDDIGATNQKGALLALTATGFDSGSKIVYVASGEIGYQTNLAGIFGTSKYAIHVRITFLG